MIFSTYGKIGDVIYSMPTIRALGGGIVEFVHRPKKHDYYDLRAHCASLGPLLRSQRYIHDVRVNEGPRSEGVNLDAFRFKKQSANLAENIALSAGVDPRVVDEAWLTHIPKKRIAPVVINRTTRYRNEAFPWRDMLAKYPIAVFIGFDHEYDDFVKLFGPVGRHRCTSVWEMAQAISGADLFIGNQSSAFAIAEGMKMPVIQETSPQVPDCVFRR